jgi:hypothetical protein
MGALPRMRSDYVAWAFIFFFFFWSARGVDGGWRKAVVVIGVVFGDLEDG